MNMLKKPLIVIQIFYVTLIFLLAYGNDDDEEEGIKVIPDDDDDKNISRSTLRRESAVVIEMLARKFEDDTFYKCQAKLEECLKSDNWLIKYIPLFTYKNIYLYYL